MDHAAPPFPAPTTVEEFRDRLSALSDSLPRRMRQCADFVAANADRIAVSTVAELAAGAEVPPSALMRFCQIMGFSGFSEMQKLFRDAYTPGWPDYSTRLRNLKDNGAGSPAALLAEFVEAGRLSLEALAKSVDEAALEAAVARLAKAETVHVVGLRRAFPVASYLAYVFEKMSVPAMLHDGVGKLDHRFALRPGDALLAITFAPYSEETLTLAQDARARGLPVVAMTDHLTSPLARLADAVVAVPEVDFGAFRSLSATIAMALALAVAVGSARDEASTG
ncbi:MAG: MurR/RpiR family transcriptional regulator [Cereibacter changlensis]|uniref:RpiR family transcriptional regulator n=2 Tax=Cereibacter changlensis TaxID=402884 RepID=A0A2T4K0J1_9RHOB|nr:MurR/RpiR family transcriptional regulator [Cereibacter changlensis]PTE23646.1 RpiR family transcriptional regulator [Cereibacter changlensis JA139]PZX54296.1 RpiR family transcriptional regulator [Cereibacter changlensis]TKA96831.1 MurR/RpiR family transcriptional regulator [Cereibacter changlensis]